MASRKEGRNVKKMLAVDQRRRQNQMLERQKKERHGRINLARMLGEEREDPGHGGGGSGTEPAAHSQGAGVEGPQNKSPAEGTGRGRRGRRSIDPAEELWKGQLMIPDWMIEVPDNLRTQWLVTSRPEGKRCLVVASRGSTMARLRSGRILSSFQSALPNGGAGTRGGRGGNDYSILDCVFVEQLGVFFVGDVMCWKGHSVYDCSAEFRLFWLQQKLAEDAPRAGTAVPGSNPYAFAPLPWYQADTAGLESAYSTVAVPFTRDGLLFMHRESHYEVGLTPLALTWKDARCSTYLSESYPGVDPAVQVACLRVSNAGALSTEDDPPVVVAHAPHEALAGMARNACGLALFAVQGISLSYPGADADAATDAALDAMPTVAVEAVQFLAPAAAKRAEADSLSKTLFQQALRTQPLSIEELAAATVDRME